MCLTTRTLRSRRSLPAGALLFLLLLTAFVAGPAAAQKHRDKRLVKKILKAHPAQFKNILRHPDNYRVQILYTQIDRDAQNQPHFTSYSYRLNPEEYFYPASTVKLPAALVALEKLNKLNIPGFTKDTPLQIDSAYSRQSAVKVDSTSENQLPSVAHYIKKIFLVSDNDAYNRLYEFIGQRPLNEALHTKGFQDVKIVHRLNIFRTPDENRHTNPITFFDGDKIVYQQPLVNNPTPFENKLKDARLGKAHYQGDSLVQGPMDFSAKNYVSVQVLQDILKTVLFPESVPAQQRFNLTPDDYTFLYKYMSMLPSESDYPKYDPKEYPDSYGKFLLFGNSKEPLPSNIRIFNKIGDAYGFMIDNAYVVDFDNKVEFMLTAVILVNEDQVFNDDTAEYEEVGFPFMEHLGQAVYQHELKRKKKYLPDLSKFKMDYR
ncbi:serine hydrolase [Pontibacter liquoris]|uniref:serine hydrolase n=1 Tax=Pontibacter liquoris TaxID=2905677 RepID=UPI001FA804A6|nr:serine hydrolase [Pontibacter liquoris]